MIDDAKKVIPHGITIDKFSEDQLWIYKVERTEADIMEKAKNAYRVANNELKTEHEHQQQLEQEDQLMQQAFDSVKINQSERAFADQRVAVWRMHPNLKDMTAEQELELRKHAAV